MSARARKGAAASEDHHGLIAEAREAKESAAPGKRRQKTWYVTEEIIERVNGAAYWALPLALAESRKHKNHDIDQTDIPDSASDLVETALWAEVLRLEKLHNQGMPFPAPPGKLRPGPGQNGASRLRKSAEPEASK